MPQLTDETDEAVQKRNEYRISNNGIEKKAASEEVKASVAWQEVGCLQIELVKAKDENEQVKNTTKMLLAKKFVGAKPAGRTAGKLAESVAPSI